MKLMENADVELFSHFDVVFKTILTDNAMKLMENEDVDDKGRKTSFDKSSAAALSGGGGAP